MINALIRYSLANRPLVLALAIAAIGYSTVAVRQLPVDVLPDLTRPTVTLLTEAPGLSPEAVEALITIPIENAVSALAGLERLRSQSDMGLSQVFLEFDWGTDVYHVRQLVQERLQALAGQLPPGANPSMGPASSLLGEILLVGVHSSDADLSPMDLRTLTDRMIVRRLQSIPGISQVLAIGGGVRQLQVLPIPTQMIAYGVTLTQIQEAAANAAAETDGGYLVGPFREQAIRMVGMSLDPEQLALTPVTWGSGEHPVLLRDVAELRFAPAIMRGDAGVNGKPGIILSVHKAPGTDTIQLTKDVERALRNLAPSLPEGVATEILFRQAGFIEQALANLYEAIRDGAVMVAIVLLLFLINLRTTLITLTAIPLSFAITIIVFQWLGVGINTMTLGGLAVAIGMVVDDAIVDVENVFRRLRENRQLPHPRPTLQVVADASIEVRSAIQYATALIILVFLPLLALSGIEGQLFSPIAIATIIAMAASFLVSITVIPVLASLLLPGLKRMEHTRDGLVVRLMKSVSARFLIQPALKYPFPVLGLTAIGVAASFALWPLMDKAFLPQFNEGSAIVSMVAAPGTSLQQSTELGKIAEQLLLSIPEIQSVGRRTGRAELDEHVMPVNINEFDIEFHPGGRPRGAVLADIRHRLNTIPGVYLNVGQPISHRIDHMLAGVEAQLAIKIFGDDLQMLRTVATTVEAIMQDTPGLTDINIERQLNLPRIDIQPDRERAALHGIQVGTLNRWLSDAIGGRTVGQLRDGDMSVDIFVRLPEDARNSVPRINELWINGTDDAPLPLNQIATIRETEGPNLIRRENSQRRIVVTANSSTNSDLISAVAGLQQRLAAQSLPPGYHIQIDGQYRSQKEALNNIIMLSLITLLAMIGLLYGHFRNAILVLQTLLNIPLACAGALILTWLVIGEVSLATLIGLITLSGIASRNTIMMLSHYLHLMRHEGEAFCPAMVVRGTLERLVPVTMTAITAAIALLPIALVADAPGKEILHPVAIAIIGGLVTSTLLDCIVTPTVFYHLGNRNAKTLARNELS